MLPDCATLMPPMPPTSQELPPFANQLPTLAPSITFPLDLPIREVMRRYANRVINQHDGNITKAARDLGISLRTLQRWNRGGNPLTVNL